MIVTFFRGTLVDETPVLTYDPAAPGLDTAGGKQEPFFYTDANGNSISIAYNKANVEANQSLWLMLAHFHNDGTSVRSEARARRNSATLCRSRAPSVFALSRPPVTSCSRAARI